MATTLYLYNMDKPLNCIKGANAASLCCILNGEFKAPYDVMHPRIVIENPPPETTTYSENFDTGYPPNYAVVYNNKLETLQRQYWIRNYTWVSDKLLELELEQDTLATFGDMILASTQYVLRSSKKYTYGIPDNLYPIKAQATASATQITTHPWYVASPWLAYGKFVVGIVNKDGSAYGASSYYMMDAASFNDMRRQLMSDLTWTNINTSTIGDGLTKALVNPMQYISSAMWFPDGVIDDIYDEVSNPAITTLDIGAWDITFTGACECKRLDVLTATDSFNLAEYHHPNASTRGAYLDCPPYMTRRLVLPPFGDIPIDTSQLTGSGVYPVVRWFVDFITGQATVQVKSSATDAVLGQGTAQLGIPMTLAQSTQDIVGGLAQGFTSILGLGTAVAGAQAKSTQMMINGISTAASGIASAVDSFAPRIDGIGSAGGPLAYAVYAYDIKTIKYPADENLARFGRPLCEVSLLNDLATTNNYEYVICQNAHMGHSSYMSLAEREIIENALNSGLYLYNKIIIP